MRAKRKGKVGRQLWSASPPAQFWRVNVESTYGGLVGALGGGKHVRGVGWSAGLERLSLLLEEVAAERCAAVEAPPPHVALLPLEGGDEGTGGVGLRLRLAQRLRSGGVAAIGYGGGAALQKRLGKGTRPRAPVQGAAAER